MRIFRAFPVVLVAFLALFSLAASRGGKKRMAEKVALPKPVLKAGMSVEEAISRRRSRRSFSGRKLSLEQLGQILWSAQGITGSVGRYRAAPSAGATYPMEIFAAVGENAVGNLRAGIYRYLPAEHAVELTRAGDLRAQIAAAALGQGFLADAPVDVLIAADYSRTTRRYGSRGNLYVHIEVGHIGQNIYLQAEALGLGTVAVGAFRDDAVAKVFALPAGLKPLYLMPVGYAR